jgi:sulfur carrier protein
MTVPHQTGTPHVAEAAAHIHVIVNGQPETFPPGATLDTVIAGIASSRTGIAAAVGETVVPRTDWASTLLHDGDEIEILTAVQGG